MFDWIKKRLDRFHELREQRAKDRLEELKWRYQIFRSILYKNTKAVELITDIDLTFRESGFLGPDIHRKIHRLIEVTGDLVEKLNQLDYDNHKALVNIHKKLSTRIDELLKKIPTHQDMPFCVWLEELLPRYAAFAGGKAASLAKVKKSGRFNVPDGFSILVNACRFFLEESGASVRILRKLQPVLFQGKGMDKGLEDEVRAEIMAAQIPGPLTDALYQFGSRFFNEGKALAVRSSALGEDGVRHSFAGQFTSVLNVTTLEGFEDAVREVIASNFSARSLAYRMGAGMKPLDFNMAVLCLEMVSPRKAGVLFTIDPNDANQETMLITALYGMGELVVSGASMTDVYRPFRNPTDKLYQEQPTISKKLRQLVPDDGGGIKETDVPVSMQERPVLENEEVERLVNIGLDVERLFGRPQDIEWAIDEKGTIWILQTRPVILDAHVSKLRAHFEHRKPILRNGLVTSKGIATGRVKKIKRRQDLDAGFSEPTILVLHRSLVDAAKAIGKVQGVLVDFGNPADHLSCVAREYGRPMLVGLVDAMKLLENGKWITVDGEHGQVFEADMKEVEQSLKMFKQLQTIKKEDGPDTKQDDVLRRLKELTIKLNLTDAYGPTFSIMECRSLHDIVRYVHEKAVIAFFEAGDELLEDTSGIVYRLESNVPFFLHIIDVGGGLVPEARKSRAVTPDEIVCRPFKALWKGISTPGLRWAGPPPIIGEVSAVMGRWMSDTRSQRPLGMPNYLIIARDYLNLNARMDFHFTMVDTVCGLDKKENYIRFRFKGGGTTMKQRHRRALAIGEILERADFFTDVKADLVNAVFEFAPRQIIEEKLVIVGRLLGFTRLIDAAMINDDTPYLVADAFYEGDYELKKLVAALSKEKGGQA